MPPDVTAAVREMIQRVAPFPAPARIGGVTGTETWLVDRSSGRFQLDTLPEGSVANRLRASGLACQSRLDRMVLPAPVRDLERTQPISQRRAALQPPAALQAEQQRGA